MKFATVRSIRSNFTKQTQLAMSETVNLSEAASWS